MKHVKSFYQISQFHSQRAHHRYQSVLGSFKGIYMSILCLVLPEQIKVAMSHSTWKMESWSAKQIFTQKFESPGFQIEHQINRKVDTSSCGIQSRNAAFEATSVGLGCLPRSSKEQQSRCLLHSDWIHSLQSSNQHEVTAWLWMSFQNVTNSINASHSNTA